jgi:hypothetical protein
MICCLLKFTHHSHFPIQNLQKYFQFSMKTFSFCDTFRQFIPFATWKIANETKILRQGSMKIFQSNWLETNENFSQKTQNHLNIRKRKFVRRRKIKQPNQIKNSDELFSAMEIEFEKRRDGKVKKTLEVKVFFNFDWFLKWKIDEGSWQVEWRWKRWARSCLDFKKNWRRNFQQFSDQIFCDFFVIVCW